MDKKTMIIAVVAVVVIVAAAVLAVTMLDKGANNDNDDPLGFKLRVYGNADNNNYLDQKDVDFIQEIVDGKKVWDRVNHPLADANVDGIIDSTDISLVKGFINGKSSTMYYMDWYNGISSIKYPLTDVLGSSYGIYTEFSTGLDMGIILGIGDKFTYMANGDIGPSQLDTTMYPMASKLKEVGIKTPDLAALYSDNVRILTGDPKWLAGYADRAEAAGFTVIKLPQNRTINGIDCIDTLVTLGVMFNKQDKTADFIAYEEKINSKVAAAIEKAGVSPLTYIIPYTAPGYLPEIYVDAHGSGSMTTADVTLLERLPLKSKLTTTAADGFDDVVSAAELVALKPDIFVVSMFAYSSSKDYTVAQTETAFKEFVATGFDKSDAKILAMPFENCSLAGISSVLVLASMIWPDAFNEDEAWDIMQEYYDKFTNYDGDIKKSKFAPLDYGKLN